MVKRILLGLLFLLLVIQFIRPQPNIAAQSAGHDDLIVHFAPPANVAQLLQSSCYDCHSDTTRYPWYANVQPVGWWLASHIDDGKRSLNFSRFATYPLTRQAKKLDQISDEVTEHSMPLASYTWIHRDARLSEAQIAAISEWADTLHDKLVPDDGK